MADSADEGPCGKKRKEVREAFSFLFDEQGAQFVSAADRSRYEDRATFSAKELLFRVSRARGDYSLEIAPAYAATSWESLYSTIHAMDAIKTEETGEVVPPAPLLLGILDFARLVETRFSEIEQAFAPANYARTVEAMEKVEENDEKEAETRNAEQNERMKFYREHPDANPYNEKKQAGPIQSLGFKDL